MRTRLVLIAAGPVLSAAPLHADDIEDRAVEAVKKLGGSVTRDDADPAHPVIGVNLVARPATDSDLFDVALLEGLRSLSLSVCLGVTDKGMKYMAGLSGLEKLDLAYTGVTDAGLKRVTGLTELHRLNLSGDKVTDEGLKELVALTKLRELFLSRTQVTDEGVAALQKAMPDCKINR